MGKKITIDPEFESLIPPLDSDEFATLEESIRKEGCRHALTVWQGRLVDGHHRYRLCKELGKPFKQAELPRHMTRDEVKLWIINNQLGRRNLPHLTRVELARMRKDYFTKLGRQNQRTSTGGGDPQLLANLPKAEINTREELAAIANISPRTFAKGVNILDRAVPEVREAVREKKLSFDAGDKLASLPVGKQKEIAAMGTGGMRQAAKSLSRRRAVSADGAVPDGRPTDELSVATAVQNDQDLREQLRLARAEISSLRDANEELMTSIEALRAAVNNQEILAVWGAGLQVCGTMVSAAVTDAPAAP
jgi:hypothetical protein